MNRIDFGIEHIKRIHTEDILQETNIEKKAAMIQQLAHESRLDIFDLIHRRGNGHWGGSASAAEILSTLYFHIMNINPRQPSDEDRDRLIVSKGHAAPMLYTLLAKRGFFPLEEMKTLRQLNSRLQGHPCMNKTPGVEMSTGALGHGLSVGLGMALAARYTQKSFRTFVIMGDGCLNEGQTWEAIMSVSKFKPAGLILMIDYNKVQLDGPSHEIMDLDPLRDKFVSFRLKVAEQLFDGHNVMDILKSWEWAQQNDSEPCVIIYKTTKGKGVSFMENNHIWHGAPIDEKSYNKGRPELIESILY